MLVIVNATAQKIVASLTGTVPPGPANGPFHGAYLALVVSAQDWSNNATIASIVEADFTGYVRQATAPLGLPYYTDDSRIAQDFQAINWQASDAVQPNVIQGYAWVDALTAGNLLALERFPAPISMGTAGDGMTVLPRIELPPMADWGEASVVA
jgi:hypothetical protein